MTDNNNTDLVNNMIQCHDILISLPMENQTLGYREIMEKIKNFIKLHCHHNYVSDYIDITPDYGCNIVYCTKCGETE